MADIFRAHGARYREQHGLPFHQLRLMHAIESCRTAALGGHRERCGHCAEERVSYNSCCNRHCPKCQNQYHHVVFTVPAQLNIHCVATGGGISLDGTRWISSKPGFFLPVRVLSRLFRRLFLEALEQAFRKDLLRFPGIIAPLRNPAPFLELTSSLRRMEWVVYSKPPFGGPQRVLEYLGRYPHRVALDNRRILNFHDGHVTFQYKQYRSADAHGCSDSDSDLPRSRRFPPVSRLPRRQHGPHRMDRPDLQGFLVTLGIPYRRICAASVCGKPQCAHPQETPLFLMRFSSSRRTLAPESRQPWLRNRPVGLRWSHAKHIARPHFIEAVSFTARSHHRAARIDPPPRKVSPAPADENFISHGPSQLS